MAWNPIFDQFKLFWFFGPVAGNGKHKTMVWKPRFGRKNIGNGLPQKIGNKWPKNRTNGSKIGFWGYFPILWFFFFFSIFWGRPFPIFFLVFSYFGPEARNLICSRPTRSQAKSHNITWFWPLRTLPRWESNVECSNLRNYQVTHSSQKLLRNFRKRYFIWLKWDFPRNNSHTVLPCNSLNHKRIRDMSFWRDSFPINIFL